MSAPTDIDWVSATIDTVARITPRIGLTASSLLPELTRGCYWTPKPIVIEPATASLRSPVSSSVAQQILHCAGAGRLPEPPDSKRVLDRRQERVMRVRLGAHLVTLIG